MRRCDVIVIGGGAIGSATAWWLARRGIDVVLLERFEPGHVRGSSHGGSRIFRLAYDQPRFVAMAQAALPLWRELEDDAGTTLLETTGGVDLGHPSYLQDIGDAMWAKGAEHHWFTPADAAERWPGIAFDGEDIVLHSPDAGRCLADDTVRSLQRRAADHGAEVRFDSRVVDLDVASGSIRTATDDEFVASKSVVVTAGSWVSSLLSGKVPLPPLRVTKEQICHFTPTDRDARWPSFIDHTGGVHYGLLTPGEGVKVAEDHTGPVVDPDSRSFEIDQDARSRVVAYVERRFPGLDPVPVTTATCLYTTTPDSSFVLERHGKIVVGSACSGHGFKFTPLTGQRLADLAMEPA